MVVIKSKTLTEFKIQNILFNWLVRKRGHQIAVPNTYLYNWEADLISITRSNFVHEYEVKISKSDFRADENKKAKHRTLCENKSATHSPKHFWYVSPADLIPLDEIPDHAGLIYIVKRNRPSIIKKAPILSKEPATEKQIKKLLLGSSWRYWAMREKLDKIEEKYHGKTT